MQELIIKRDKKTGVFTEQYKKVSASQSKKITARRKKYKAISIEYRKKRAIAKEMQRQGIGNTQDLMEAISNDGLESVQAKYREIKDNVGQ